MLLLFQERTSTPAERYLDGFLFCPSKSVEVLGTRVYWLVPKQCFLKKRSYSAGVVFLHHFVVTPAVRSLPSTRNIAPSQ